MKGETRKQKILNHIKTNVPSDKKIVLITVTDPNTGEIWEEEIPMFKCDIIESYRGETKMALEPYLRLSLNKDIINDYLIHFTQAEKGNIYDIIMSVDCMGRLKYGDNYQQYCRSYEDIAYLLGMKYETFRKKFLQKLKEYNIIRSIEISKGKSDIVRYISFNPALAMNGVYWDRWTILIWEDVIRKHNLLTDDQIRKNLHHKVFKNDSKYNIK